MNRRAGLLNQELRQPLSPDLLQRGRIEAQLPAHVDHLGQSLPVPLARVGVFGQVLFNRLEHLALRHPLGLVFGVLFGQGDVHVAIVARLEFRREHLAGPDCEGLGAVILRQELGQVVVDLAVDHLEDQLAARHAVENLLAVPVDALPLLVHDFVVFEQVLPNLEIPLFHLLLSTLDAPRNHPAFDRLPAFHAQAG